MIIFKIKTVQETILEAKDLWLRHYSKDRRGLPIKYKSIYGKSITATFAISGWRGTIFISVTP